MQRLLRLLGIVAIMLQLVIGPHALGQATEDNETSEAKFVAIVLGASGGLIEGNLSAYLLAPSGSTDFICLDAGTVLAGIRQAHLMGSFGALPRSSESGLTPEGWVLHHYIKAYLLSHAHLDHVAGLILNSTDDVPKPILGLPTTLDFLRDHLFNWKIWPNFGHEGAGLQLKKYRYVRLAPEQEHPIAGTAMTVEPFRLSHSHGYQSTAFLIQSGGFYTLYFGDTGPDTVENSARMQAVWSRAAPLIRSHKLRGLFLEVSFPDGRPDKLLFGHLTPAWMMQELHRLARLVRPTQPEQALRALTVVVTHIKPSLKLGPTPRSLITQQLAQLNDLGVRLIIAQQGQRIEF
ncbi:MAG: 3',5'-cyclic-nucleotide phosphodiesterase [Candidatus Tectomicrobia bacterium]